MSDGPYKSLPMKRPWKDVCERAYKESYSEQERAESMFVAFHSDFRREVGPEFDEVPRDNLVESCASIRMIFLGRNVDDDGVLYRQHQVFCAF